MERHKSFKNLFPGIRKAASGVWRMLSGRGCDNHRNPLKYWGVCIGCFCVLSLPAQSLRTRYSLNQDWRFALGHAANPKQDFDYGRALSFSKIAFLQESTLLNADQESSLHIPHTKDFDDSGWQQVSVPHDWGMTLGFDREQFKIKGYRKLGGRSPENSVGWYRKTFHLDSLPLGCRYTLEFEGIFRDAQVWMNGIYLGRGESGYVPLVFDVTECLDYGAEAENVICVRVDATHSELWSYEGAGIYRNVWLTRTHPIHVAQWGTSVSSQVDLQHRDATVNSEVEVQNDTDAPAQILVKQSVSDPQGCEVAVGESPLSVPPLESAKVEMQFPVRQAELWSLDNPARYRLHTYIYKDGKMTDHYETPFGIRDIRFDADKGFFLNGERVQIQGVCCHQDHAGVGIGVPDNLNVWRIARLKEFGANAYRASHNPPTESVLYACDSLGMLVMDEMRVLSASDEGLNQMETVVRRDRNHPSVILWCLGNEEPAIQGTEKGRRIVERMKECLHKLDPTRPCTAAMNGSWGEGFTLAVDVQGSNYFSIGNIDAVHQRFPQLPCIFTEEASTLTTRGIYQTDASNAFHQAYDRDRPGWGATAQSWMRYVAERPFVAGAFVWTGFDYGGESLTHYWPGVVSNFGILDYCGFPKDAFWYYKAQWTHEPVLHILPHWNGIGQDSVDVHLYTNMEEVELVVNGKSLGKKKVGKFDIPSWRVRYAPGKLVAKGWKAGRKYTEVVETTGSSSVVVLADETGKVIRGDGSEVAVVTVQVQDRKGRLVPTADNRIDFQVENGHIVGVGNGNPSCHEPDCFAAGVPVYRNVFNGYAQVLVVADGSGKPIRLTAASDGLKNGELTIPIFKATSYEL